MPAIGRSISASSERKGRTFTPRFSCGRKLAMAKLPHERPALRHLLAGDAEGGNGEVELAVADDERPVLVLAHDQRRGIADQRHPVRPRTRGRCCRRCCRCRTRSASRAIASAPGRRRASGPSRGFPGRRGGPWNRPCPARGRGRKRTMRSPVSRSLKRSVCAKRDGHVDAGADRGRRHVELLRPGLPGDPEPFDVSGGTERCSRPGPSGSRSCRPACG